MKYQIFKNSINRPYFRTADISFKILGLAKIQLPRWSKIGYIENIKKGLYVFSDAKRSVDSRTISFLLYEPSYISLESALSHYGLIPEIVPVLTCVSTRVTRTFINSYGKFMYRHIKSDLFWGYDSIITATGKYLLAEPEKALLDYIYFNQKRLRNEYDIRELRLNEFEFRSAISVSKLKKYLAYYNSPNMNRIIILMLNHVHAR